VLNAIRARWPWLRHVFADGHPGDKLQAALADKGRWTFESIKRSDTAKGMEEPIASATAFLLIAHIRLLTRRIASHCSA